MFLYDLLLIFVLLKNPNEQSFEKKKKTNFVTIQKRLKILNFVTTKTKNKSILLLQKQLKILKFEETNKLSIDIYSHDKGSLNIPRMTTHFSTKNAVTVPCLCRAVHH